MTAVENGRRRQEQVLEVNSLVASAPEPLAAQRRILECIREEVGEGLDEASERHIMRLCTLMAAAEMQRLASKTGRELADMLDLYNRIRRELRGAEDACRAAGILARSVVPVLADVCLVDLAEGPDRFRRAAVETSHLVPEANAIKAALENSPDRGHGPHDPRVVARTGIARLLSDVSDEDLVCASSTQEDLQALRSLSPTGYLCVPLEASGGTSRGADGVMTLLRVRPGQAFTDTHKNLVQALGEIYCDAAPEPGVGRNSSAGRSRDHNGANGRHADPSRLALDRLTPRELEVLKLFNQGYTRESLAQRLNISTRTYDRHTRSIRNKLGADNNLAALAKARDAGLHLED